jgi:hypothetical protein
MNDKPILVPLREHHLDFLQWLGEWTPEVHRANWKSRRQWPPGWREAFLDSTAWSGKDTYKNAVETQAMPPDLKQAHSCLGHLLKYGLIEGSYARVLRLTKRGRAALKLKGRPCPESFKSHCADIFDDVDLLPVRDSRYLDTFDPHSPYFSMKYLEPLPDTEATWRDLMNEYNEATYHAKGTLTKASARLTQPSGSCYLNGSLREHNRWLSMSIENNVGQRVCEVEFSLEGFMEMLTSNSSSPATLNYYTGMDGIGRAEPCAPPISPMRRMQNRLKRGNTVQHKRFNEIREAIEKGNMGKRLKADLLSQLDICENNADGAYAFAAEQAVEEVSTAVESMMSVATERLAIHGAGEMGPLLGAQGVIGLLTQQDTPEGEPPKQIEGSEE